MDYNKTLKTLRRCVRDLIGGKINEFDRVSMIKKIRDLLRLTTYNYKREKSKHIPQSRFATEINSIKRNFKTFLLS